MRITRVSTGKKMKTARQQAGVRGIEMKYPALRKKWKGMGVQNGAGFHSVKSEEG